MVGRRSRCHWHVTVWGIMHAHACYGAGHMHAHECYGVGHHHAHECFGVGHMHFIIIIIICMHIVCMHMHALVWGICMQMLVVLCGKCMRMLVVWGKCAGMRCCGANACTGMWMSPQGQPDLPQTTWCSPE